MGVARTKLGERQNIFEKEVQQN